MKYKWTIVWASATVFEVAISLGGASILLVPVLAAVFCAAMTVKTYGDERKS